MTNELKAGVLWASVSGEQIFSLNTSDPLAWDSQMSKKNSFSSYSWARRQATRGENSRMYTNTVFKEEEKPDKMDPISKTKYP